MEPVLTQARPPLTDAERQFHIEEYKSLRSEILQNAKAQSDLFVYTLLAVGGMLSWLLTHKADLLAYGPVLAKAAMFIPFLVTALAFFWVRHYNSIIIEIGKYNLSAERRIAAAELGWETFIASDAERDFRRHPARSMLIGWSALMVAGVVLAVLA